MAESYQPGVSVSLVARRNDVNANLLFTWRRRYSILLLVLTGCRRNEILELRGDDLNFDTGEMRLTDGAREASPHRGSGIGWGPPAHRLSCYTMRCWAARD